MENRQKWVYEHPAVSSFVHVPAEPFCGSGINDGLGDVSETEYGELDV